MIAAKGRGDDEEYTVKAVRYRRLNEEYEAFSKAAGLRPQYERGNIAEFGAKEAKEARKAALNNSVPNNPAESPTRASKSVRPSVANQHERVIIKINNSELENGLPIKGTPNSIVDKTDETGKTLQRRIYGADGMASIDYDTSDHNLPKQHPTGAHKHIFDYSKKKPRGGQMALTEEELTENSDIIQRGVNYRDEKRDD